MAQLAEQLICNQQVIGSSPIIGLISIEIINFISRDGAVWKLVGLITRRSQVQILPPLLNAQIAQLVEQRTENPRVAGSIPALGIFYGALAQSVEHLTFNQVVRGSNPRTLIIENNGKPCNWLSVIFLRFSK